MAWCKGAVVATKVRLASRSWQGTKKDYCWLLVSPSALVRKYSLPYGVPSSMRTTTYSLQWAFGSMFQRYMVIMIYKVHLSNNFIHDGSSQFIHRARWLYSSGEHKINSCVITRFELHIFLPYTNPTWGSMERMTRYGRKSLNSMVFSSLYRLFRTACWFV